MSSKAFTIALEDNASDIPANKGWNLVGNPWQAYYNIHKLNYTAPISVWNGKTYEAYSLADDDYAIRPNEAFFVQSPGGTSIEFPIDGRQLTDQIDSQNAARTRSQSARQLIDIEISSNVEQADKTRLVLNPDASTNYEISRDAGKLMSMDANIPQIYSLGLDGEKYAINERPTDNGQLGLGIYIGKAGSYTISATRNSIGQVLLKDHETGIITDLSLKNYSFNAETGTNESRLTIFFGSSSTGISTISQKKADTVETYTLDGRKVTGGNLKPGVYVVCKGQQTKKVIIK